ncbi:hypothetical protein BDB01DRAFT_780099 [Pilobolus umbonatus]|nr:hypothetical protein BDB01DRAFT_780099 [Pilobolus umbonatus]
MNQSIKRKHTMTVKKVQFSSEVVLMDTYSAEEYDRSGIYSTPILYKVNPSIKPQLTLTIQPATINTLPELDLEDISSADLSPDTPDNYNSLFEFKKKKKRPILSVDTSICTDPLFFTKLSTNYTRLNSSTTPIDHDYLIPITASII